MIKAQRIVHTIRSSLIDWLLPDNEAATLIMTEHASLYWKPGKMGSDKIKREAMLRIVFLEDFCLNFLCGHASMRKSFSDGKSVSRSPFFLLSRSGSILEFH